MRTMKHSKWHRIRAPIYEEIYQDMVKLMDANTEHGDKLEKILTMVELITLIAIIAVIALAICSPPDRQSACTEYC